MRCMVLCKAKSCSAVQGEKDAMDAEEAVEATATAANDSEGVVAKEAAAVKAEAEAAGAAPGLAKAELEADGSAAASDRAASEQDASTSGRDTVPGASSAPECIHAVKLPCLSAAVRCVNTGIAARVS